MTTFMAVIGALLMVGAGAGIGWQLAAARPARRPVTSDARPRKSPLRILCARAFGICADQLAASTHTANDAVGRLTAIFSSTVKRLEATTRATSRTVNGLRGNSEVMETISRSESDLQLIVQVLQSMHRSREAMLAEVARYSIDLKELAADVQRISMQVRLLSFNTAVEAARDVRSGAGFGVVAREMRELATMADDTASRMVKKVETIDGALARVFADEVRVVHQEVGSIAKAEEVIRGVTDGFRRVANELSETLEVMERETQAVHAEISDALFALQFQDRVSQIQSHISSNLKGLAELLAHERDQPVNADEWLRRMALDFIADGTPSNGGKTSAVTFF